MKVLDASELNSGINRTVIQIKQTETQVEHMMKGVRSIISLDQSLRGSGGDAIRSFYERCHEPFLQFLSRFLSHYNKALVDMKNAILTLDKSPNSFIRQSYMESELDQGLNRVLQITRSILSDVNNEISSVGDIVPLPYLSEESVAEAIQVVRHHKDETISQLQELDNSQAGNMHEIAEQVSIMKNYITKMQQMFETGDLSIRNFDVQSIEGISAFQDLQTHLTGGRNDTNILQRILDGVSPFEVALISNALFPFSVALGSPLHTSETDIRLLQMMNKYSVYSPSGPANFLDRALAELDNVDAEKLIKIGRTLLPFALMALSAGGGSSDSSSDVSNIDTSSDTFFADNIEWVDDNKAYFDGQEIDFDALGIEPVPVEFEGEDLTLYYKVVDGNFIFFPNDPDTQYYSEQATQGHFNWGLGKVTKGYAHAYTALLLERAGVGALRNTGAAGRAAEEFLRKNAPWMEKTLDSNGGPSVNTGLGAIGFATLDEHVPIYKDIIGTPVPSAGTETVIIYLSDEDGDGWDRRVKFTIKPDGNVDTSTWRASENEKDILDSLKFWNKD